ncbi:MAG TPA: hypothetical protein VHQ64_00325 [Pyrinomonadaceae bacterium]|jgi:hypothetical protein|nr:hypothetical protein [Pyrinomonadaceae bacterium]
MTAFLISVSAFLLLLAGSCSSPIQNSPPVQKGPWSIDFKTSGGFAGSGKGNIVIDSEGKCSYSLTNRDQVKSSVTGTLYPRQLQPISDAVARLDPQGWSKPELNVAAPDAFGYKLELRTGPDLKDVTTVQWYDNTAGQLPTDLKRLDRVLEEAMKTRCVSAPSP